MSYIRRQIQCLLLLLLMNCVLSAGEGTGTGLAATYWANETLSGTPTVARTDAQVNFNWGGGAAVTGMPVDSFSARWDGEFEAIYSESLTLIARTDDGVRLWINGSLVIDAWVLRGAADSTYTFTAEAGQRYRIRMEYYEHFGSAVAQLEWQSASLPRSAIPTSQLYPTAPLAAPIGGGTGLLARYYSNETLSDTPVVSRIDATVDFNWGGMSPHAVVPVDSFSVRWDGEIEARYSEPMTLTARTDDGVRVWLDGILVIDAWVLRSAANSSFTFSAEAGHRYRIRMEYFEHTGAAVARLWWQSASEFQGPIPTSQLYPTPANDPPVGTGTGLLARFYANETLSGAPVLTRTDARVDFDWTGGSPGSGVPTDIFSARWDGEIEARTTEALTLILRTDDGVRLWVDDQLVINAWMLRGAADSIYTFNAQVGQRYRIRIDYFEHHGSAVAKLWWQSPSEPKAPVPSSQLYPSAPQEPPLGTGTGLAGSYFTNESLTGAPAVVRLDPVVDFDWAGGSPAASVPANSFSARWEGEVEPRYTEDLTIIARTDDGVRVWLNDAPVISSWVLRGAADSTYTFAAQAGQRYRIRMEYYEHLGSAVAKLWWQSAHELRSPIPTSQLYPAHIIATPVLSFTAASSAVSEKSGSTSLAVNLSSASTSDVTVSLSAIGSGIQIPDSLTILAGETTGSIPVTLLDDTRYGPDRQVTIAFANPVGATLGQSTHVLTLQNTEAQPTISFTTSTSANLEQSGTASVIVRLSAVSAVPTTVSVVTSGTATAGTDYTVPPVTLQIPADTFEATIFVPLLPDSDPETNETVVLTLANPVYATLGAITAHTLTISDGNQAPVIVSGPTPASNPVTDTTVALSIQATDDGGSDGLTVVWSGTGPGPVTFEPSVGGLAFASNTVVTFPAPGVYAIESIVTDAQGTAVSAHVQIVVISSPKAVVLNPEMATVSLNGLFPFSVNVFDQFGTPITPSSAPTWSLGSGGSIDANGVVTAGAVAGGPHVVRASFPTAEGTAQLTIVDAQPTLAEPPQAALRQDLKSATLAVLGADDGGEALLTYTWSSTGPTTVTFTPNGSHDARDSVATFTQSGDYVISVTISDQQGQVVVSNIPLTVTAVPSVLAITPPMGSLAIGSSRTLTLSAVDQFGTSTTVPQPVAWSATGPVTLIPGTGSADITGVAVGEASIRATSDGLVGTATWQITEIPSGTVVTVTATTPQTAEHIPVVIYSSSGPIVAPAFQWLDISGVDPAYPTGALVTGLTDDNNRTIPLPFSFPFFGGQFSQAMVCSNGWISFTDSSAARSPSSLPSTSAPKNMIAFYWRDLNPAAGGSVYAGQVDPDRFVIQFKDVPWYNVPSKRVSAQVVLYRTGNVDIAYAAVPANEVSYTVGLQNGTGTSGLLIGYNQNVAAAGKMFSITRNVSLNQPGVFTVQRTGDVNQALDVLYDVAGNATPGHDYIPLLGRISIPSGQASAEIRVNAVDDFLAEPTELVSITLAQGQGYTVGNPASADVGIISPTRPVVSFTTMATTVRENEGTVTVQIALSSAVSTETRVKYALSGTAELYSDFDVPLSDVVFAPGEVTKSIEVYPYRDSSVEPTETISISLVQPTGLNIDAAAATHVISITDSTSLISVEVSSTQINEQDESSAVFRFHRSGSMDQPISLTLYWSTAATANTDFTGELPYSLLIPANTPLVEVPIAVIDDDEIESDETIYVYIEYSGDYELSYPNNASIDILDNEVPLLAVNASTHIMAENQSTYLYVMAVNADGQPIYRKQPTVVSYAISGIQADDVNVPLTGSVTIPPDSTDTYFWMTVKNDAVAETIEHAVITWTAGAATVEWDVDIVDISTLRLLPDVSTVQEPQLSQPAVRIHGTLALDWAMPEGWEILPFFGANTSGTATWKVWGGQGDLILLPGGVVTKAEGVFIAPIADVLADDAYEGGPSGTPEQAFVDLNYIQLRFGTRTSESIYLGRNKDLTIAIRDKVHALITVESPTNGQHIIGDTTAVSFTIDADKPLQDVRVNGVALGSGAISPGPMSATVTFPRLGSNAVRIWVLSAEGAIIQETVPVLALPATIPVFFTDPVPDESGIGIRRGAPTARAFVETAGLSGHTASATIATEGEPASAAPALVTWDGQYIDVTWDLLPPGRYVVHLQVSSPDATRSGDASIVIDYDAQGWTPTPVTNPITIQSPPNGSTITAFGGQ